MNLETQAKQRETTVRRRRAPGAPTRLTLPFGDPVTVRDDSPIGPFELEIHATDETGALAPWLDDDWWAEAITHWADDDVTVRIAPTPGALTHPVLRHQLDMLRRVVPSWRIVATVFRDDVNPDTDISAIASSPYHEIRFMDQPSPHKTGNDRVRPPAVPVLFSRIRTVQAQRGTSTPILVRMPPTAVSH